MSETRDANTPSSGSNSGEPQRASLKPIPGANRSLRRNLGLKDELVLATVPTMAMIVVLGMVELLSQQRVLFASLASSAFLIYLDPEHGTNSVRSLFVAHLSAALVGAGMDAAVGAGYGASAAAMVITILLMITLDAVHPPAVGTALSFAFRSNNTRTLTLFILAVLVIVVLIVLQRIVLHVLAVLSRGSKHTT